MSSSEFGGVYGFGMSLGSLYFNAQGCFLGLLENQQVNLSLELVGSQVMLDFSVGTEAVDELWSINVLWNQEFSGVLKFWI